MRLGMNRSAGEWGLARKLAVVGTATVFGAVSLATLGAGTAGAQTASAASYRGACPAKPKIRQKNARRATAKRRSWKGRTACRPTAPTPAPPNTTSGGPVSGSPDSGSTGGSVGGSPDRGATSDPATTPSFLQGLSRLWADDCSNPDPIPAWGEVTMQRKDGQEYSSTRMSDIASGRFQQFGSGGPANNSYYRFTAPQGDNVWTPDTDGRSELSQQSLWSYEGQRRVTLVSIRLPSSGLNQNSWNTLVQWKQNEGKNWTGGSPALALAQFNNEWRIGSFGSDKVLWRMPNRSNGQWVNFAFDITYSANPSKGKIQVHADFNGDGAYEYTSPTITAQTLLQQRSGSGPGIESHVRAGLYEGVGGDSIDEAGFAIYG